MTRPIGNRARRALACALVALFSGCVHLEAVRQFAKTSAATADYPQIVADYVRSPARQKRYQPDRADAELEQLSQRRAAQKPLLEGAQRVLVEYLSALGDLAADELPNVDSQIDGIGKALEKAKFIGEGDGQVGKETATAARAIAKILTRVVIDHGRQAQLSRVIRDADPHVQTVVQGLQGIVTTDFDASLRQESEAVTKPFDAVIAAAGDDDPAELRTVARILRDERVEQLESRRAQGVAYAAVLHKIGQGHADLVASLGKLDAEDLKERLGAYSKDLRTLCKAFAQLAD
jgi:hypothetical protein